MYLSQIAKCFLSQIEKCICLKLQNVFVSNFKMYLCQIANCKLQVMAEMLRFIYTGRTQACLETMASDLLAAADKWELFTNTFLHILFFAMAHLFLPATCWRQLTSKNFLSKQHLFYCKIPKNGWKRYCKILYRAKKKSLSQDIIFFSWNLTWVSCKKDNLYWQIPSIFSFSCCRIIC